jgi:hypothetical protein
MNRQMIQTTLLCLLGSFLLASTSKASGVSPKTLRFIQDHSQSQPAQKALLQLAEYYALGIQNLDDPVASRALAKKILGSELCVRSVIGLGSYSYLSKIHALSFSNSDDAKRGIRLNSFIAKAMPYLPPESHWARECEFSVVGAKR